MAKQRMPLKKAEVSGATLKNPWRYRDRTVPRGTKPLGEPFACMTPEQREAWEEFRSELPWLNSAHRAILHLACVLRARLSENPDMGVSAISTYSAILSKLGATPADESKIVQPDGDAEDPEITRFFTAAH